MDMAETQAAPSSRPLVAALVAIALLLQGSLGLLQKYVGFDSFGALAGSIFCNVSGQAFNQTGNDPSHQPAPAHHECDVCCLSLGKAAAPAPASVAFLAAFKLVAIATIPAAAPLALKPHEGRPQAARAPPLA